MKIYNLSDIAVGNMAQIGQIASDGLDELGYPNYNFIYRRFRNTLWKEATQTLLNECPVFIVETSQGGQLVEIPGHDAAVRVPYPVNEDKAMQEPIIVREEDANQDETLCEEGTNNGKAYINVKSDDFLGVYLYNPNSLFEHSIFVWADRIDKVANGVEANFNALMLQVVLHEYSHFLMNPCAYGDTPSADYSYSVPECCWMEEACANAFSLAMCWDKLSVDQQAFIESFVKSQPKHYAKGWELFNAEDADEIINEWIQVKVLMAKRTISELNMMIRNDHYYLGHILDGKQLYCCEGMKVEPALHKYVKRISVSEYKYSDDGVHYGIMKAKGESLTKACFEEVESAGKIAVGNVYAVKMNGKWAVISKDEAITGFNYDCIWSFDKDGYCQVAIDDEDNKRKYGYINAIGEEKVSPIWNHLYKFENNVTIAKLENTYYIINKEGKTLVSGLPYQDVRAFKNGHALACRNGLWGLIDYEGKEIVECKYEFLKVPRV